MRRGIAVQALLGIIIGLALGCGASDKPPTDQKPAPTKGKVYRTPEELFADMPKDAYPKSAPDAGIERAAAVKWCNANLVGRRIEGTATVEEVSITGDDPFRVVVWVEGEKVTPGRAHFWGGVESSLLSLGDQECSVMLSPEREIAYDMCTLDEAKTVRGLKGKTVVLRTTVTEVSMNYGKAITYKTDTGSVTSYTTVLIYLGVSVPSLNGFLPEASKGKEKR